jgi:catechol 2,3-dioxygenase-like lactoylglutathione lyase family enzyme
MGLADAKVSPAIPVSDMERAKAFYEGTLGLSGGADTGDGGHDYPCGDGSELHVFPSPEGAGGSASTIAAFQVNDIEATVEELIANGARFEQYGEPLNTDERGIATTGDTKTAWVKDPDGNLLAIFQTPT